MSWELPMSPYCWLLPTYISRGDPSNYQKWIVDISQNSNQHTELYINGRKLEPSKLLNPSQLLCFIVEFLKFYSRNSQQVYLGVHRIWVLKTFYGMFMFSRRGNQSMPFIIDSRIQRKVWLYQEITPYETRISTALNKVGGNGDTYTYVCWFFDA